MILSVSTWSAHPLLLSGELGKEQFVAFISQMGATGMEIVDFDFQDSSLESMKELQRIGQAHGVEVTCMSIEHDLCMPKPEDRKKDIEKVKRWIDISAELKVSLVRVFTGWHKERIPYERELQWVYEGLAELSAYAAEKSIDLVLENHNDVCLRAEEILKMMDSLKLPNLYTCPDIFNYKKLPKPTLPVIDEESFAEIEALLPYAKNEHMKICEAVDGNRADKYLDLGRMIDRMKAHAYDGALAIEFMWPYMDADKDHMEELGKAIQVLKYQMELKGVL